MEVMIANPEYIISRSGKKPANNKANIDFSGYRVNSKQVTSAVDAVGAGTETAGSTGLAASIGTLSISSLCRTSMSFLSKLVQMIEFSSMLRLFNFEYEPLLGGFLEKNKGKSIIPFPLIDKISNYKNSIASQWKGKLSEAKMAPYFLQEFGYTGIPVIVSTSSVQINLIVNFLFESERIF